MPAVTLAYGWVARVAAYGPHGRDGGGGSRAVVVILQRP